MIKKPIFILGSARSGTTILYESITKHKELAFTTDNTFYVQTHPFRKIGKILSRKSIANLRIKFFPSKNKATESGDSIWKEYQKGSVYTISHYDENIEQEIKKRIEFILNISNKTRFIDKNPEFCLMTEILEKMFPDAKFIFITRRIQPIINSLLLKEKSNDPTAMNIYLEKILGNDFEPKKSRIFNYIKLIKKYHSLARKLQYLEKSGRYLQLRYEDFVKEPDVMIKKIFDFCELNPATITLDKIETQDYKWKKNLSSEQIEEINDAINQLSVSDSDIY